MVFVFFAKNSYFNLNMPETEDTSFRYVFDAYDAPQMKSQSIKEFDELITAIEENFKIAEKKQKYYEVIKKFFKPYPKR